MKDNPLAVALDPNAVLDTVTPIVTRLTPGASVVQVRVDGDGYGVVLYTRPDDHLRYVVHRWATKRTDGSPVEDGGMLYSGGYHPTYEDAVRDFDHRTKE